MLAMIKLLIAPRNLRRYVGRHRARWALFRTGPVTAVDRDVALMVVWQQTAN